MSAKRRVLTLGLISLLAAPTWAARLEKTSSTLRILQKQGKWELEQDGKVVAGGRDLSQAIELSVEKAETLSIVIGDQNPLLYTYTKEIVTTDTADFTAASSFAATLAQLVTGLAPTPTTPLGGEAAPEAAAEDPCAPHQTAIAEANGVFAAVESDVENVRQALEDIPRLLVASASTDTVIIGQAKQDVASWGLDAMRKRLNAGWPEIEKSLDKLSDLAPSNDCVRDASIEGLRLQTRRASTDTGLAKLAEFAPLMAKVDTALNLASVSFTPNSVQTVTIKIAVNSANATVAKSVKAKALDVNVVVSPYAPIRLGYGGAVVYSFVDDPSFSTEKVDDGFRIVESSGDDDFVGQKVAAMLTLAPRAWERGTLSGEINIGINPEDDAVGIFLGGGIRFSSVFSFGIGLTFQEVRKLGAGLVPGAILTSPDELKLDTEFETGFFLAISATTK